MALAHSPNVVTNGLVFYYDMANTQKSWKGVPTTNFYTNGHFSGGTGITQESGSNATNTVILFPANPGNSEYVLEQSGGPSTEYQINLSSQLLPNTTYVLSGWYGESIDYVGESRMFHCRAFSSSGAHVALGTGIGTVIETRFINGITWKYCFDIITTPSDYSNDFNWYLGYGGGSYTGKRYYTNIQMEQGSYPNRFVNGARSTSQALLDTISNKTITSTNLNLTSYSDNKAITLNGTNQYLYTSGDDYWNAWSPNGVNGNSSLSIELIFNSIDTGGLLVSRPWNGSGQYNYTMYDNGFGLHSNAAGASLGYSSICTGQTTHMVWWMNATQYGVYKNGQVYVAATNHGLSGGGGSAGSAAFGTLFGSLYPYGEGWGGEPGFSISGKYYLARIYNRVLTPAEVQQNFNALAERFFGYQNVTYTTTGSMTLTNNGTQEVTMSKPSGGDSWNTQAYSTEMFTAPCTIEFSKLAGTSDNGASYAMIGWNTDPTTNESYDTIDHASYPYQQNGYIVYNNGSPVNEGKIWDPNKRFYLVYDIDGFIRHYNGNQLIYSANYGTGNKVYVDSSIYSVGSGGRFTNVKVSRRSWNGYTYV
jgi:hypothetical protein